MANGDDQNRNNPNAEGWRKANREAQSFLEISEEINKNQTSILRTIAEMREAQQRLNRFKKEQEGLEEKLRKAEERGNKEKIKDLKASIEANEQNQKSAEEYVEKLKKAVDHTSLLRKTTEGVGQAVDKVGKSLKDGVVKELRSAPGHVLETTKEIKSAELRMGMLSSQAGEFTDKLTNASQKATQMGATVGDLAEFQASYNAQIGRSVSLTEQGLNSMTALAEGTMLGKEGAVELTAEMDLFGKSVQSTEQLLDDTLETADEMNVSFEKTVKNLQEGTRLARRFHFEEGTQDLSEMAARSAKFRMNMEAVAPMAEKVFNVEGAVETAAQLQVMGGEVAKMADPFTMMFEARHDFDAFHESVVDATKGMATFNEETGEIEFEGLQLHRLREIAERTGIEFDELAKSARQAKKFSMIEGQINMDWGGFENKEEAKKFLEGAAQINEQGKAFIEVEGERRLLENLENPAGLVREQMQREKTIEELAKERRTFDESWTNFMNSVKATLLPGFKAFSDTFTESIQNWQSWWDESGLDDSLKSFGETAGKLSAGLIKFVSENPLMSLVTMGATAFIGKRMQWVMRGRWLGTGFMATARKMGMMGPGVGGGGTGVAGGAGSGYARSGTAGFSQQAQTGGKKGMMARAGRGIKSAGRGGMNLLKGGLRSGGVGMVGGLAGMGLGAYRSQQLQNEEIEKGGAWDKGLGATASALQYGGTGAMLGSMFGPIGAAVGGIGGAAIGGLAGAGAFSGGEQKQRMGREQMLEGLTNKPMNDFVMRPGEGAVPFSEEDTLVGMKEDGPIQKSMEGGSKEVSMSFESPLEVRGSITLDSKDGTNLSEIDLDRHPQLVREIATKVQEQLSKNMDGGKLSPNPSFG